MELVTLSRKFQTLKGEKIVQNKILSWMCFLILFLGAFFVLLPQLATYDFSLGAISLDVVYWKESDGNFYYDFMGSYAIDKSIFLMEYSNKTWSTLTTTSTNYDGDFNIRWSFPVSTIDEKRIFKVTEQHKFHSSNLVQMTIGHSSIDDVEVVLEESNFVFDLVCYIAGIVLIIIGFVGFLVYSGFLRLEAKKKTVRKPLENRRVQY